MLTKTLVILVALTFTPVIHSKTRNSHKIQTNSLSKARCDLMCFESPKEIRSQCRSRCRSHEQKPGTCPVSDSPKWAAACVEACNSDFQCDGVQRCCHHGCGSTCSDPLDLLIIPGLPALPVMDETKEKKRAVLVRWSDGVGDSARSVPGRVFYLLEEQHHLGPKYEESRLGEWNLLLRTNKTKASLRNILKPGRWYRFRVAAVNASGTRGFSSPSDPFTPRRGPRPPPMPKKLKVRPLKTNNGTVTIKLEWKEPHSDLPVVRYKVFWSRRVRGLGGELDSVLVNHQTVPKDQNSIEIKDLQPNSMYFLQVQTISQFGVGKLRSEKASIFYNTTNNMDNDSAPEQLKKNEMKIKGLKLHRIIWNNHKMKARISWDRMQNAYGTNERYYIHWKTVRCHTLKPNKSWSATTQETSFDLHELDYQCNYKVNVNRSPRVNVPDSELMISVPGCEYFKQKVNITFFNCVG